MSWEVGLGRRCIFAVWRRISFPPGTSAGAPHISVSQGVSRFIVSKVCSAEDISRPQSSYALALRQADIGLPRGRGEPRTLRKWAVRAAQATAPARLSGMMTQLATGMDLGAPDYVPRFVSAPSCRASSMCAKQSSIARLRARAGRRAA